MMIFIDLQHSDSKADKSAKYRCRAHVGPEKEAELQHREREGGWPEGRLRERRDSSSIRALAVFCSHSLDQQIRRGRSVAHPNKRADLMGRAKPSLKTVAGHWLDSTGALVGDGLLAELTTLGFGVRRFGDQAALDDNSGQGRVPDIGWIRRFADLQGKYSDELLALKAPDQLAALIAREGKMS